MKNTFKFDDDIVFLADVPHLLKNMRNALVNNNIIIHSEFQQEYNLPTNIAKYSHIVAVMDFDKDKKLKIAPHLAKVPKDLGNFEKMKVSYAQHALSRQTGHAIRFLVSHHNYPQEMLATAVFCELIGKWYDLMSARGQGLAFHADNPEENHSTVVFLNRFINFYCSLKLHKDQQDSFKPTQVGVILSTNGIIKLKDKLLEFMPFFLSGKCTNDPIEQYHGEVRSINKSPTCNQFKYCAKSMGITQYLAKLKGGSYDAEDSAFLIDFQSFKKVLESEQNEQEEIIENLLDANVSLENMSEKNSLAYFAGVILKRSILGTKNVCKDCATAFISEEESDEDYEDLISTKEFKKGALTRPTKVAFEMFFDSEVIFRSSESAACESNTLLGKKITAKVLHFLLEKFPKMPDCHIDKIFSRFIRARLCFEGRQKSRNLLSKGTIQKEVAAEANASKTTKALKTIK